MINRGVLKLRALLPAQPDGAGLLVRAKVGAIWRSCSSGIDLLAWPTVPAVAPSLAEPMIELPSGPTSADAGNARQGVLANLTGVPGVSVPVGLDAACRRHSSCSAPGAPDAPLLDAAEALERATDREFVELRPAAIA